MEVKEIQEKNIWENFLLQRMEKTFLQSFDWGEFQKTMRGPARRGGGKIWRFGIYDGRELVAVALVVKVAAKRGTFLLLPHAPVVAPSENEEAKTGGPIFREILSVLLQKLKQIAKEERVSFIRINPIWKRTEENTKIFKELGFINAPIQMHPEASWKLNVAPSEEELLKNMRKTTRYLIRQAQENTDIEVHQSATPEDVKLFSELHKKVSQRQHFVPFSLEYLQNEVSAFGSDITIFWGKYKGNVAAASLVVFWSGVGFYHHAVSLPEYSKIPVPYALQWEAIKEAKRRGCSVYDFWGYVDPKTQSKHPWAGPTLFKMGFGGEAHEYVKTQDFPLSLKYGITLLFEKLRKFRRNL